MEEKFCGGNVLHKPGQPVVNVVLLYIALRFTTYTKLAPGFQGFPENRR